MKKNLIFFIFIFIYGCESISFKSQELAVIDCPNVFFSTENSVYIHGYTESLDLEKIDYKASLNNYGFVNNCFNDEKNKNYQLDILILVEPFNPKNNEISLPIFIIFYDNEDRIVDKQYFRVTDNLKYNQNEANYIITEVTANLNISLDTNLQADYLTIGFVKLN